MSFRYEHVTLSNDNLKSCLAVDATYVITKIGNGSNTGLEAVRKQLQSSGVCKNIHILSYSSLEPLVFWIATIFKDADQRKYDQILVLEDRCILSTAINEESIKQVNQTLLKHQSECFVYRLGCVPFLMWSPENGTSYRVLGIGTYACIYSKALRQKYLADKTEQNFDVFLTFHAVNYAHAVPLAFPAPLENMTSVGSMDALFFFIENVLDVIALHRNHNFIYTGCYTLARNSFSLLFILLIGLMFLYLYRKNVYAFLSRTVIYGHRVGGLFGQDTPFMKKSLGTTLPNVP